MKYNNKTLKITNLEEIETDQLIWDIENCADFYVYELSDDEENTNILVKIQKKSESSYNN